MGCQFTQLTSEKSERITKFEKTDKLDDCGYEIYKAKFSCKECSGSGKKGDYLCDECDGQQWVYKYKSYQICKRCNGSGKEHNYYSGLTGKCRICNGSPSGFGKVHRHKYYQHFGWEW